MSDAPRPLGPDDVHVWYTFTDEASGAAREAAYLALLGETERARHAQVKFAEDRHCFLVAHALLRTTLSRYAAIPPGSGASAPQLTVVRRSRSRRPPPRCASTCPTRGAWWRAR